MTDEEQVLREMRRLAPRPYARVVSVFSEASIPARREWYPRLGHDVVAVDEQCIRTATGFSSEHFSEARLRRLLGDCLMEEVAGIGYFARTRGSRIPRARRLPLSFRDDGSPHRGSRPAEPSTPPAGHRGAQ